MCADRTSWVVAGALLLSLDCCNAEAGDVVDVTFDKTPLGAYTKERMAKDWPKLEWSMGNDRCTIIDADESGRSGRCLRVKYPKGAVGPGKGGAQFVVPLPDGEEYYLGYWVNFREGFDFRHGGKLPGLSSNGGGASGGNVKRGYEWSARYMWGQGAVLIGYLYHAARTGDWGNVEETGVKISTGKWHRLVQRVKLNTGRNKDGILQVWYDGKLVVDRKDMLWRHDDHGKIDSLFFSTFHGGNGPRYAPANDCHIYFDDFVVSTDPKHVFSKALSAPAGPEDSAQKPPAKKKDGP